jgi:hypothetical protein
MTFAKYRRVLAVGRHEMNRRPSGPPSILIPQGFPGSNLLSPIALPIVRPDMFSARLDEIRFLSLSIKPAPGQEQPVANLLVSSR